jgi:thymidylate synthase (FAD)
MKITTTNGYNIFRLSPIDYVDKMGSDLAVCDAARVSFDKAASNYTENQNNKLLNYLAKNDHWSPFAHCILKLRFRAPMFVARQFQKHVVGFAWNEVSRRYVSSEPQFFIPKSFRKRPENMKQGSVLEGEIPIEGTVRTAYVDKIREHAQDYNSMIRQDICPEQVRMFMPQSMMTEWIWTGSLMAWARFVSLRSDSHAQAECYPYADMVKEIMYNHFPMSTQALLPKEQTNDSR